MTVYDFDNTIYSGESSMDFFLFCLKKKKSLILYLPYILYTAILYKLNILEIEKLYLIVEKLSKIFLHNKEDISIIVSDFWNQNNKKLKPQFLNKINNADVIITASPYFLIKEILKFLNTKNILCTDFDIKTGKLNFVCYKENKAIAFKEKYGNCCIQNLYTDSMSDKPLMDLSINVYLVKKNGMINKIK